MKVLSPYYITVPFIAPLSGLVCTEFTLNLFIYSGLKSAVPINPTYSILKQNPTISNGITKIDISRLVADFIEFNPEVFNTTGVVNASNQLWVKTSTTYKTTNLLDGTTQTNIATNLATKGYSYGLDGENAPLPLNKILIPIIDYKVNKKFVIPILISETTFSPYSIISYPNRVLNIVGSIPATTNSNNLIKNIWVNIEEATNEEYIEVIYNLNTITLLIEKECRYNPIDILFQNKEGVVMILPFFKKRTDSLDITNEEYESNIGQPNVGNHQFTNFNVQGRTKFNVNSGFVDEQMNEVFRQLMLSERVWIYDNTLIPINIESKSIEYKTRANDRLINYNINFKYAFNEINNI